MATKYLVNVQQAKMPTYERTSRMRNYDLVFDPIIGQIRVGFYRGSAFKNYILSASDTYYTVEAGYENRIDLIAMKFYNSSIYDWIIIDANNIADPIKDITVGKKLIIPDMNKIYSAG